MFKKIILLLITTLTMADIAKAMTTDPQAQKAIEFFQKLDKNHLDLVEAFYDKDVEFQDPVHKLHGAKAIRDYYAELYGNVDSIRFEFTQVINEGSNHALFWKMYLKTQKLNGGKEFAVDGISNITFGGAEGKAISHRDYFDMGDFVYERIPVLGSLITFIKNRMAN